MSNYSRWVLFRAGLVMGRPVASALAGHGRRAHRWVVRPSRWLVGHVAIGFRRSSGPDVAAKTSEGQRALEATAGAPSVQIGGPVCRVEPVAATPT